MQLREERQQQSQTFAATIVGSSATERSATDPRRSARQPRCARSQHRHDRPHEHERYLHPFQRSESGSCAAAGGAGQRDPRQREQHQRLLRQRRAGKQAAAAGRRSGAHRRSLVSIRLRISAEGTDGRLKPTGIRARRRAVYSAAMVGSQVFTALLLAAACWSAGAQDRNINSRSRSWNACSKSGPMQIVDAEISRPKAKGDITLKADVAFANRAPIRVKVRKAEPGARDVQQRAQLRSGGVRVAEAADR